MILFKFAICCHQKFWKLMIEFFFLFAKKYRGLWAVVLKWMFVNCLSQVLAYWSNVLQNPLPKKANVFQKYSVYNVGILSTVFVSLAEWDSVGYYVYMWMEEFRCIYNGFTTSLIQTIISIFFCNISQMIVLNLGRIEWQFWFWWYG